MFNQSTNHERNGIMQDKLNLDAIKNYLQQPIPRQILFFDEMLTPRLLQLVYWAALVAVIWSGLGQLFSGTFYGFVEGLVLIAFGCLVARVASELVMLLFQLHKNIETLAKNSVSTDSASAQSAPATRKKQSKKVSKKA